MPRLARISFPGVPHHVIQRGNNQQDVFFSADDRQLFLQYLSGYGAELGLDIMGFCLMTNHVHMIVVPHAETSLAHAVGRTLWRYSQAINRSTGRSGHVWQGRFYSCALDDAQAYRALAYVERNPVRAKMVRVAWEYPWSSAPYHVGLQEPPAWLETSRWEKWTNPVAWKAELRSRQVDSANDIRFHTIRGRPFGCEGFVAEVESVLGRRVRPLSVGRPRKDIR